MAAYLKTLDPNHLVTSGGEGFFGATSDRANANPQVLRSLNRPSQSGVRSAGKTGCTDRIQVWMETLSTVTTCFLLSVEPARSDSTQCLDCFQSAGQSPAAGDRLHD